MLRFMEVQCMLLLTLQYVSWVGSAVGHEGSQSSTHTLVFGVRLWLSF